jgi:asparaginyl-tRNA synthetase
MRTLIVDLLERAEPIDAVCVGAWIRTKRVSKTLMFLELNDGSSLKNLQVIIDEPLMHQETLLRATTGASVFVHGRWVASEGKGQQWELIADSIELIGEADETFPLQKKGHSVEFLRSIGHLRPRTQLMGAVLRLRSRLAFAVHSFFNERRFTYVHTPIITASDCEGAGELFRVTTLDPAKPPMKEGAVDYAQDFFGRSTFLTVSGQLEGETLACALSNIYTFGPTFRAENSHTSRHASEFWMIEPEMAFCDLQGDMDLAEAFIRHLVKAALETSPDEIAFFERFVDHGLSARLKGVLEQSFQRVTYTAAVSILQKSGVAFQYPVEWGTNLQSEHERYLTEQHFKCPVTVYNYPKTIKPFYMRLNDDGKTVAAMDVLVPSIGEIIGGSQREERFDYLLETMESHQLNPSDYTWYLDLRRYGTVPHSGFGLGFERMLMFVSGISNIRDVIAYPRTPGNAGF